MSEFTRPDWDEYFLGIATAVAARADCRRRKVGAVIVRDNRIVATGYNGSYPGGPSCLAGGCPRGLSDLPTRVTGGAPASYDQGPNSCIAVHAELNAIMYCGRDERTDATIYITDDPCSGCLKHIRASGIVRVVTAESPDGFYL